MWFKAAQVSVSNGSAIVTVNSGEDVSIISASDALIIGSFSPVEIKTTYVDGSGNRIVELVGVWNDSSQTTVAAKVLPTAGDFIAAVAALREATTNTRDNFAVVDAWGSELGMVDFTGADQVTHTARTMQQMDADVGVIEDTANGLVAGMTAMREVDFEANRQINREKFDYKSGFVEYGKHVVYAPDSAYPINEGLWTSLKGDVNRLIMGRVAAGVRYGASSTNVPVISVAGICFDIDEMNGDGAGGYPNAIRFPDAPNGTVTYDSADGSIVDFTKDVDPKYGDVASTVNEAVARAFEGLVANGDFRSGNDGKWTLAGSGAGTATIDTTGFALNGDNTTGSCYIRSENTGAMVVGTAYDVEFDIVVTAGVVKCIEGLNGTNIIKGGLTTGTHLVKGHVAITSEELAFQATSSSTVVKVTRVSVRPVTNEVVTERVDLAGIEFFPEQITPANPEVYPKGMIQSGAATVNGIATKSATTRPDSYYAVFDGDTASNRQCVDWFAATNEQRATLSADPSNLIEVMANGDVVQWRARQRTIAGAGNGDWLDIDSATGNDLRAAVNQNTRVAVQGTKDTVNGFDVNTPYVQFNSGSARYVDSNDPAVFYSRKLAANDVASYNGECYFLVLGTVPRLNQGAYHPSFNVLGCGQFRATSNGTTITDIRAWHEQEANYSAASGVDCFVTVVSGVVGIGKHPSTGYISSTFSGRPGNRFYDAIYVSDRGGFNDKRISISANLDRAISQRKSDDKSGISRGGEKLVRTAFDVNLDAGGVGSGFTPSKGTAGYTPKDKVYIEGDDGIYRMYIVASVNASTVITATTLRRKAGGIVVHQSKTNLAVSGEFNVMEVIGDPADIRQVAALKGGWFGYWGGLPISAAQELSRKALPPLVAAHQSRTRTLDNGLTWAHAPVSINNVTNKVSLLVDTEQVTVINYTTNAKLTKESTNPVVYRGEDGLGSVFTFSDYRTDRGGLLQESLSGLIGVSNNAAAARQYGSVDLVSLGFNESGKLHNALRYEPAHQPIRLGVPNNDSPAIKALWGTTEINGQLFPVYWWTELNHNGTDFGDDSLTHVNNNTTTMTDLNGNTVKVGCAVGVDPIGWADKL
jgi:hypothetical protein